MPDPDTLEWNRRYLSELRRYIHKSPRPLLAGNLHYLPDRGLALDAACGPSPSGLFLAGRGWDVIGLDVAEAGLRHAQSQARKRGVRLSLAVMDLSKAWLPPERFDLILNFYFLFRSLWPIYRQALKPGGLLLFETFLWSDEPGSRREFYLQPGELRAAFSDWEILYYAEDPRLKDGQAWRKTAALAARKPLKGETR